MTERNKIKLSAEEVTALMQQAVAAKGPEYTYPTIVRRTNWGNDDELGEELNLTALGEMPNDDTDTIVCLYVENGTPSCIVGHVLHMAGVPLGAIAEYEDTSAAVAVSALLDVPDYVVDALAAAQSTQDNGKPWGEALGKYEVVVRQNQ